MAGLKVYYDLMSQPSRAVYLFLKKNNILFIDKAVAVRKGEHFSEEITQKNRFQKVPFIDDNGFVLRESIPILKYFTLKNKLDDHWYPQDFKQQIRVDEYLHWHHFNTRFNPRMIFRTIVIEPNLTGKPINWSQVEHFKNEFTKTVTHLEKAFLCDGPYLCNRPSISICDILGVCELMQLYGVYGEHLFETNKTVQDWVLRVKNDLDPHFDEAHKTIYRIREEFSKIKGKL